MNLSLFLAIWLISGIVSFFGTVTYFQKEFPQVTERQKREDMGMAILFSFFVPIIGPICLFAVSGFFKHGFK